MIPAKKLPRSRLSSPAFPFRTAVLSLRPSGRTALRDDAERALEAIDATSRLADKPTAAALDAWAQSSDERVAIALLSSTHLALSRSTVNLITNRAFRVARSEGAILTPVLDALLSRYWIKSAPSRANAPLSEQTQRALARRCFELRQWLCSGEVEDGAYCLLAFSSYEVHDLVIRHARHLPMSWLELSTAMHPDLLLDRRRSPKLHDDTARKLLTLILGRAMKCTDDEFLSIIEAVEELTAHCTFSVAECARLDRLIGDRRDCASFVEQVLGDRLREALAVMLSRIPRTSRLEVADLTCLLSSTNEATRRAAFDLAGALVHQPQTL